MEKIYIILQYIIVQCHGSFVMFTIWNILQQKYFVDIKHVTVTADFVTELAHSMLKSFTPQTGMTIEEENIFV